MEGRAEPVINVCDATRVKTPTPARENVSFQTRLAVIDPREGQLRVAPLGSEGLVYCGAPQRLWPYGIVRMDNENKPAIKGQKKRASPRKRGTAEAAATTARTRTGSVSVPAVPKRSASAISISRRTSALPVGVLIATLLLVSAAALVSEAPAWFGVEPSEEPGARSRKVATPSDPLAPHVRESLNQELRLATFGLDLRQTQEGIVRLTEDARALTESVQALASGVDELKSDVSAARIDAAAARAHIEERVREFPNLGKPVLLGDPALRKVAHQGTSSSDAEVSDGVVSRGQLGALWR